MKIKTIFSILISLILIFLLIIYADSESTFIRYGLFILFTSGYISILLDAGNYIYHDTKITTEALISWPFTIIETVLFYHYGWYELMILWPILSYVDLRITEKPTKDLENE